MAAMQVLSACRSSSQLDILDGLKELGNIFPQSETHRENKQSPSRDEVCLYGRVHLLDDATAKGLGNKCAGPSQAQPKLAVVEIH